MPKIPLTRRIATILSSRQSYANTKDWLSHILSAIPSDIPALDEDVLTCLEQGLRGGYGSENAIIRDEFEDHIRFWSILAERFPSQPKLSGILADTLLLANRTNEALDLFLKAFQREPTLLYHFGGEIHDYMKEKGGKFWMEYQLALVRAALSAKDEEYAQEIYLKLLEEYQGDEAALARIRSLAMGRFPES